MKIRDETKSSKCNKGKDTIKTEAQHDECFVGFNSMTLCLRTIKNNSEENGGGEEREDKEIREGKDSSVGAKVRKRNSMLS